VWRAGGAQPEGRGHGRATAERRGTLKREDGLPAAARGGLYVGGSSGINVAAAVWLARRMGPGHTIVTLLRDRGDIYRARLFNREWLCEKGLEPELEPE